MERYRLSGLIKESRVKSLKPILGEAGFENVEISQKPYPDYKKHREFSAEISVENEGTLDHALRVVEDRLILPGESEPDSFISFGTERDLDS